MYKCSACSWLYIIWLQCCFLSGDMANLSSPLMDAESAEKFLKLYPNAVSVAGKS